MIASLFIGCNLIGDCEVGKGPTVTRTLSLSDFHSLNLSGSDKVYISQGEQQEVVVEGQQNIIDILDLRVQNGLWEIRISECVRRHEQLVFYITLPEIKYLALTGSGKIIGEDRLISPGIEIKVTGSGSISAEVNAALDCEITGSGEIILSGNSEFAEVEITGSGKYDSYGVQTADVEVNIQGSGDAYITATEHMDVRITGSGNVYYRGNPLINSSITGSGKLISKN